MEAQNINAQTKNSGCTRDVPVVVTACVLHNIHLVNKEIDDFLDDGDDVNDSRDDDEIARAL